MVNLLARHCPQFLDILLGVAKVRGHLVVLAPRPRSPQEILSLVTLKNDCVTRTVIMKELLDRLGQALGAPPMQQVAGDVAQPPGSGSPGQGSEKQAKRRKMAKAPAARSKSNGVTVLQAGGASSAPPEATGISAPEDKDSLTYHQKKMSLSQVLAQQVKQVGNLVNAASTSGNRLIQQSGGLRTREGEELLLLAKVVLAGDALTRNGGTLPEGEWKNYLKLVTSYGKQHGGVTFPPSFCCLAVRRAAMTADSAPFGRITQLLTKNGLLVIATPFDPHVPDLAAIQMSVAEKLKVFLLSNGIVRC